MTTRLRDDDPPPDDTTLVFHGGIEDSSRYLRRAITDYEDYRELTSDGYGLFALSVFAAWNGITVDQIKATIPNRVVGETTAGEVVRYFRLLPTSEYDDETGQLTDPIQIAHYDLILLDVRDERLLVPDALEDPAAGALRATIEEQLRSPVERFCEIFRPRRDKRTGTIEGGGSTP